MEWLLYLFVGAVAIKAATSTVDTIQVSNASQNLANHRKPVPANAVKGSAITAQNNTTISNAVLAVAKNHSARAEAVSGSMFFAGAATSIPAGVDPAEVATGTAIYAKAKGNFYSVLLAFMAQMSRAYQTGQAELIAVGPAIAAFSKIVKSILTFNFGGIVTNATGIVTGMLDAATKFQGDQNLTPPIDPQGASSTGYGPTSFLDGASSGDHGSKESAFILSDLDAWISHLNSRYANNADTVNATINAARAAYLAGPGQADWVVFCNAYRQALNTIAPGAVENTTLIYPTGESVFGVPVAIPGDAGFWPGYPGIEANGAYNALSPAPPPRTWQTFDPGSTTIPDNINGGKRQLLQVPPGGTGGFQSPNPITAAPMTLGVSAPLMVSHVTGASVNTAPYGQTNSYPVDYWTADTTSLQLAMYWG